MQGTSALVASRMEIPLPYRPLVLKTELFPIFTATVKKMP